MVGETEVWEWHFHQLDPELGVGKAQGVGPS